MGFRVRQTPEEDRRTYRPKRYGNNNKDEDNSPKTLNDKIDLFKNYSYSVASGGLMVSKRDKQTFTSDVSFGAPFIRPCATSKQKA